MEPVLYIIIFSIVPVIFAGTCIVTVLLFGCCVLTPGKVVRIMFPYIKRNGNNTVVFGFILAKWHICGLFWIVSWIIYEVTLTFCANILIMYRNSNNLFSATSIELQCIYANGTIANLTAIERLELDEDILCYAINFNIAGAMGQATGALAFGWVVTSILTWVVLNVNYCIIQHVKNSKRKLECYKSSLSIIIAIIILQCLIAPLIIVGLCYIYYDRQWFLYLIKPENKTILTITVAMIYILNITDIRKEPKSLEECCRETMKAQQIEEMSRRRGYERTQLNRKKRSILREMAEQECKKMIAYETAVDINDEEELKNILLTAYNNIMKYNEDREEKELRRVNGPIEDNDDTSSSNEETNVESESDHNPQLKDMSTERYIPIHKKTYPLTMRTQKKKTHPLSNIHRSGSTTEQEDTPIVVTADIHTAQDNEETSL